MRHDPAHNSEPTLAHNLAQNAMILDLGKIYLAHNGDDPGNALWLTLAHDPAYNLAQFGT